MPITGKCDRDECTNTYSFSKSRFDRSTNHYCSPKCYFLTISVTKITHKCANEKCNNIVNSGEYKGDYKLKKFCSLECAWDSKRLISNCEFCNNEFTIKKSRKKIDSHGKFCSLKCYLTKRDNDYELLQKKLYPKTLELRKKVIVRRAKRKYKQRLKTGYVSHLFQLQIKECPDELIQAKKSQLLLLRQLPFMKNESFVCINQECNVVFKRERVQLTAYPKYCSKKCFCEHRKFKTKLKHQTKINHENNLIHTSSQ